MAYSFVNPLWQSRKESVHLIVFSIFVVLWSLSPLPLFKYSIYKVGSEAIPDALLPHGAHEDEETWRHPVQVPMGRDLKNRLLAISQATEPTRVPEAPVYGFIVVVNVSDDKSTFTVLSPCPYEPPNNLLLLTTICYVDTDFI